MEKIILFYKYVSIDSPKQILKWQHALCTRLGIKGRIILAHEGINATIGGPTTSIEGYKIAMNKHRLFDNIDFKESMGASHDFPRLRILIKEEIVRLGVDPNQLTPKEGGIHLSPQQAHALMKEKPDDLVILDCRNEYETCIGTFTDAIRPSTKTFREFPKWLDTHIDQFKDKQVLMDCTGGIRCERASAYLKQKGVAKEVYQIKGGIHRYVEQYPDGFFRGKNYVFDGRVAIRITNDILGTCYLCSTPCDDYVNCCNVECNLHFISCSACIEYYANTCSNACKQLVISCTVRKRIT